MSDPITTPTGLHEALRHMEATLNEIPPGTSPPFDARSVSTILRAGGFERLGTLVLEANYAQEDFHTIVGLVSRHLDTHRRSDVARMLTWRTRHENAEDPEGHGDGQ